MYSKLNKSKIRRYREISGCRQVHSCLHRFTLTPNTFVRSTNHFYLERALGKCEVINLSSQRDRSIPEFGLVIGRIRIASLRLASNRGAADVERCARKNVGVGKTEPRYFDRILEGAGYSRSASATAARSLVRELSRGSRGSHRSRARDVFRA